VRSELAKKDAELDAARRAAWQVVFVFFRGKRGDFMVI
jgi:hypothetical protein